MTVYVDDMRVRRRVGGGYPAIWSHLFADTHDELVAFAVEVLGMQASWIQKEGTHREHFDVVDRNRSLALAAGALPLKYPHDTGELMVRKRRALRQDRVDDLLANEHLEAHYAD